MANRPDLDALSTRELYERGVAAARVGEADEARQYLLEATSREPGDADAWLWLASVEPLPQTKKVCFERVLALRPDDPDAKAGLARLAEKYGQGVLKDEGLAEVLHCYWHPDRETGLRCTRCNRPICPDCARPHPVGWRCKECAKELRSPLYKVTPVQIARGFLVGLVVSVAAAAVVGAVSALPWFGWFLGFVVAAPAGTAVAEAVSAGGGRKRGRPMQIASVAAIVVGAGLLWFALAAGVLPRIVPVSVIGLAAFAIVGGASAYARLR